MNFLTSLSALSCCGYYALFFVFVNLFPVFDNIFCIFKIPF